MPASKKILIITYYWPPAGGPGVQRWLKFTKYLPDFGVEPFVLTVDEKQASYPIRDASLSAEVSANTNVFRTPTRDFYSLYLRFTGRKNVPFSGFVQESKPNLREKLIRFLRTHLFIPDPRKGWNKFAYRKACEIIQQEDIQNMVTTGPPHSTHLTGLRLKRKFPSLIWIADFRDPWTRIFFFDQLGHSFFSRRMHKYLERKVLYHSNKVIVVGHSMKNQFLADHGALNEDRVEVIPNGFDDTDFEGVRAEDPGEFILSYTGTLSARYPLEALISSIKTINKSFNQSIRLRFIGEINSEIQRSLYTELGDDQVECIPSVGHAKVIEYLLESSMLVLLIPDAPGNKSILTGKLFEYLAAKKPILGIGPVEGDAAHVLNETGAGCMFEYTETDKIQRFILNHRMNMNSALSADSPTPIEAFSRKSLTSRLSELLK